jgi:poly(beta-D-mannuronate) lyase
MKLLFSPSSVIGFLALLFAPLVGAAEHRAAGAGDIERLMPKLAPGDSLVLADGTWRDVRITFQSQGTAEKPITLRAEHPGKVTLAGNSSLAIEGAHLVVSGLLLQDARGSGDGIRISGRHCRLTECAVVDCAYRFFAHLAGSDNRIDHCYLAGKTNDSPTLQVEVESRPNHHRIDHNHFGPRPPLGRNGGETIRLGYSWQSMSNSATVVEHNLFERCDGEIEIISNKSCENIYQDNTFADCAGMLTLRHGNRCRVDNNFFIGHHKRGSGGIRVIGEDHTILNNYIDGVAQGGIWVTAGIPDSPLKGYFQARRILIAFNTIVDSAGPCVDLSAGLGSSGRTLLPADVTLANNLLAPAARGILLKGKEGAAFRWVGNLAAQHTSTNSTAAAPDARIRFVDAKLARDKDGLWRPAADSPVRGAAQPMPSPALSVPPRPGVGSDLTDSTTRKPLTAADVGPSWLPRR